MAKKIKKRMKGSALAYGLVIMTVVMILLVSILSYIVSQLNFSANRTEREKAFQVAEAGIYYYRWYLAHATDGMNAQQLKTFWQSGTTLGVPGDYTVDYNDPETGTLIGRYTIHLDPPDSFSTIASVTSTGESARMAGITRKVKARFRRPSWSEYIFLSNDFMNFGNQAEVYGKVYSNNGIRFDGIAHNVVSALLPRFDDPTYGGNRLEFGVHTTVNPADPAAPSYPWPAGTVPNRPNIFMGGRQFPVPEVSFSGVMADFANMKSQSSAGQGRYFDSTGAGRKITLKSDGTYDICTVNSANANTHAISDFKGVVSGASGSYSGTNGNSCTTSSCCAASSCPYIQSSNHSKGKCVSLANYPIVNDGVVFVEKSVWLEGSVNNKRMTIAAANLTGSGSSADIYIGISNNNLRYASYNCNNMLGLVAQQDIRVLPPCPDEFVVDAALLAQTGTVGINDNGFSGKTSLTFNGAIASFMQPYFQHGNSGFAVRTYNYDNNLLYCPPPYFPTGTEYSIDLWEEL
jgi:hypothetical protein